MSLSSLRASLLAPLLVLISFAAYAQTGGVRIGTTGAPDATAALDVSSASKGLLIPRMDSAARMGIAMPTTGLLVFQTGPRQGFYYYGGGAWLFLPDKARSGDNLGNHTATRNLNLGANQLVGNGGTAGLSISTAGDVSVAGAVQVPAAKSYDIFYAPNDFQPNEGTKGMVGRGVYSTVVNGSLQASLHLPQGAVLTNLVLYFSDYNNGGSYGIRLTLERCYTSSYVSTITTYTSTTRPGNVNVSIPVSATIDNTSSYSLRAAFGATSAGSVTIIGVKVTYTVTQVE